MLRDPSVKLDDREAQTLLRIADGDDEAEDIAESDVSRLQALGLVEQRGRSMRLTSAGIQILARLRRDQPLPVV